MGNTKKDDISTFDKRTIKWNLSHDMISKNDLEAYLKALPDDAENAVEQKVWEEPLPEDSGLTFSSITLENS